MSLRSTGGRGGRLKFTPPDLATQHVLDGWFTTPPRSQTAVPPVGGNRQWGRRQTDPPRSSTPRLSSTKRAASSSGTHTGQGGATVAATDGVPRRMRKVFMNPLHDHSLKLSDDDPRPVLFEEDMSTTEEERELAWKRHRLYTRRQLIEYGIEFTGGRFYMCPTIDCLALYDNSDSLDRHRSNPLRVVDGSVVSYAEAEHQKDVDDGVPNILSVDRDFWVRKGLLVSGANGAMGLSPDLCAPMSRSEEDKVLQGFIYYAKAFHEKYPLGSLGEDTGVLTHTKS